MSSDGSGSSEGHTAAVCVRGHAEASSVESLNHRAAKRCSQCGADVLTRCEVCGSSIRGVPAREWREYEPPAACRACGTPFPWLGLAGRVGLLRGLLGGAGLDDALDALADPDLDGDGQARRWAQVKRAAPAVWAAEKPQRIIATILDADTRLLVEKYAP